MESAKPKEKVNPRKTANILSIAFFWWIKDIIWNGFKRNLGEDDLFDPLDEDRSNILGTQLERKWKEEIIRSSESGRSPSLVRVLGKTFAGDLFILALYQIVMDLILKLSQPLLLRELLLYFKPGNEKSLQEAVLYASGIVICTGVNSFLTCHFTMAAISTGMKIRIACSSLVYRKVLSLSRDSLSEISGGKLINILSNDMARFDVFVQYLHSLWISPLTSLVLIYFIWIEMGVPGIMGLAVLIFVLPTQVYFGILMKGFRHRTAEKTDVRVKLIEEIISAIRAIKMYVWEEPYMKMSNTARRHEIKVMKKMCYLRGLYVGVGMWTSRAAFLLVLVTIILFGGHLASEKVFVCSLYYGTLLLYLMMPFLRGTAEIAETLASVNRVKTFLLMEEFTKLEAPLKESTSDSIGGNHSVLLKNVDAKWNLDSSELTLKKINMTVNKGELVIVIGTVGSGKSSLLQTILGELHITNGSCTVSGKLSYSCQEAWVFAATVRQNIIFGTPLNRRLYETVIKVCDLSRDFQQLPLGDKTTIGERGTSLSGGQKARINLARALYDDADIYLFDDPLSAVDTQVGKHLFEQCIMTFLAKKTRILVTHQLQYLQYADQIIIMSDGKISMKGTFEEFIANDTNFINLLGVENPSEFDDIISLDDDDDKFNSSEFPSVAEMSMQLRRISFAARMSRVSNVCEFVPPIELIEEYSVGKFKGSPLIKYFRAGNSYFALFLHFLVFLMAQIAASFADFWVSIWTTDEEHMFYSYETMEGENLNSSFYSVDVQLMGSRHHARDYYMYILIVITLLTVIFCTLRTFLLYHLCMKSSEHMHKKMISSVMHTKITFFDENPSGRILNRFSKDMGSVDEILSKTILDTAQVFLNIVGSYVTVIIVNYILLIPLAATCVLFYYVRKVYVKSSTCLRRLEGICKSPVLSHLSATIHGLSTIRSSGAESILIEEFDRHQDLHTSTYYIFQASSVAFGMFIDALSFTFTATVIFSLLLFHDSTASEVGLSVTLLLFTIGITQWAVRQSAEVANNLISVERVLEYIYLDHEPEVDIPPDFPLHWPTDGCIQFQKTYMKYIESKPFVLKNLSFTIHSKEKVGIVGRTGAGKSSVIAALFRFGIVDGPIIIDGLDTKNIPLKILRSKISIIPQDPVLFSGTLRHNLDPFNTYCDFLLWSALENVELKNIFKDTGGLDTVISEGGSNLSVGQKQLLCLARAIIRDNKILVLDEATANVDTKTDTLIQNIIRQRFVDCTVITIAHRLNTIIDNDKILVIDSGRLEEFDHPHILLQNHHSLFYKMVDQTGKQISDKLRRIAEENYRMKNM